jgi:hypothetical protein
LTLRFRKLAPDYTRPFAGGMGVVGGLLTDRLRRHPDVELE